MSDELPTYLQVSPETLAKNKARAASKKKADTGKPWWHEARWGGWSLMHQAAIENGAKWAIGDRGWPYLASVEEQAELEKQKAPDTGRSQ